MLISDSTSLLKQGMPSMVRSVGVYKINEKHISLVNVGEAKNDRMLFPGNQSTGFVRIFVNCQKKNSL
jgi:hypothetical protein